MKWLYVTGRSQQKGLGERDRERKRGMDNKGEAGRLTDGLTGWIAELAGCC